MGYVGYKKGFGKALISVSNGIIGKIATFIVFYFTFGVVLTFPFVKDFLTLIVSEVQKLNNGFLSFIVLNLRLDLVLFAVIFFFVIVILRKLIVKFVCRIFSINKKPIIVLNKILGVILAVGYLAVLSLILMQILYWVTGANGAVYNFFKGSFLSLDWLFLNNPVNSIISSFSVANLLGK
jgi:hypothetical protein